MRIGGFEIQDGGQPYIVAEVGSNWHSFEDCILSVQMAAASGANAVKFQLFNHQTLYGYPKPEKSGYQDRYELQLDWLPRLKQWADQSQIDFMCTAFSPESLRVVDPYVYAHKVASSDINYEDLLTEANRMGKPVFVSTGAATPTEIMMATTMISSVPVVVLYCVSGYPAKTVDLTIIDKLKMFSPHVGYSDHTTDAVYIPYAAAKFHKACVIEKHFTAIKEPTPDSPHSLNASDFKLMVDRIRGIRVGHIGPTPEEQDMILRHKRRLVVTGAIKKGETLKRGANFGVYRSTSLDTRGLSPWSADEVNGKVAAKDLHQGETIGMGDFRA